MKLVVIENDWKIPDTVTRFIRNMKPVEVREFTNFANCDKKDFFPALMWCDTIIVETTLINTYQIDEMVELMSKIREPKQIIFTWEDTVNRLYEYLKDEDDIVKIAHHKIGHYSHTFEIEDGKDPIIITNLFSDKAIIVAERLRVEEELRQIKLAAEKKYRDEAPTRLTGQTVLIKTIQASGKEWSTLKTGDIVPALDMTEQDPRANRGIWVWGLTEPVKLLNDSGYDEYEIITTEETPLREIALEVLKMVNAFEIKEKDVYGVIGFIEAALAEEDKSAQLHWTLTAWLDDNDIPRRGNRNKIETYLNKVLGYRLTPVLVD